MWWLSPRKINNIMAHLTQLWNDKLRAARGLSRDLNKHGEMKQWSVRWDDPDFGKGEKTYEETFSHQDEAVEYAISIGLKYDLRKRNGKIHQLDPNQSRFKSGYSPLPDILAIPAVWPTVSCYGHMPADQINEYQVALYCKKHGITKRPEWAIDPKDRNSDKRRETGGPLSFDDMLTKRQR
jgi:hypothetical protein